MSHSPASSTPTAIRARSPAMGPAVSRTAPARDAPSSASSAHTLLVRVRRASRGATKDSGASGVTASGVSGSGSAAVAAGTAGSAVSTASSSTGPVSTRIPPAGRSSASSTGPSAGRAITRSVTKACCGSGAALSSAHRRIPLKRNSRFCPSMICLARVRPVPQRRTSSRSTISPNPKRVRPPRSRVASFQRPQTIRIPGHQRARCGSRSRAKSASRAPARLTASARPPTRTSPTPTAVAQPLLERGAPFRSGAVMSPEEGAARPPAAGNPGDGPGSPTATRWRSG